MFLNKTNENPLRNITSATGCFFVNETENRRLCFIYPYRKDMINILIYIFHSFKKVWYITIVLRDKEKHRKKDTEMKKLSELLKEYYEVYREGRG